jgi:transposase-like protein
MRTAQARAGRFCFGRTEIAMKFESRYPPETRAEAVRLRREEGLSTAAIARRLGPSRWAVAYWLRLAEEKGDLVAARRSRRKSPRRLMEERRAAVDALWEEVLAQQRRLTSLNGGQPSEIELREREMRILLQRVEALRKMTALLEREPKTSAKKAKESHASDQADMGAVIADFARRVAAFRSARDAEGVPSGAAEVPS